MPLVGMWGWMDPWDGCMDPGVDGSGRWMDLENGWILGWMDAGDGWIRGMDGSAGWMDPGVDGSGGG